MFELFRKKETPEPISVSDSMVVAPADGEMIPIEQVNDKVFSQKMMGDGVAFKYDGRSITLCAPANGVLSMLYPTGHAFGVTMNNGVQIMVHIGLDTVEANGDGFRLCSLKQDDPVKAGDPIVEVDLDKLRKTYDMTTMLIVVDANGQDIRFNDPCQVKRGDSIIEKM